MHDTCQFPRAGASGEWATSIQRGALMRWTAMVMPAVAFAAALRLYPLLDGHAWGPLGQLSAGLLMSALVLALVAWLRRRERLSWDIIGHLSAGRNLRAF